MTSKQIFNISQLYEKILVMETTIHILENKIKRLEEKINYLEDGSSCITPAYSSPPQNSPQSRQNITTNEINIYRENAMVDDDFSLIE